MLWAGFNKRRGGSDHRRHRRSAVLNAQTDKAIREYVWLGDTPIAVFTPDPANSANPPLVYYIHTDHLDTPRVIVDRNNAIRWRWMAEPFGTSAAETNPSGLGQFSFNLRFPGQYFDQESGLFYNMARYYDPSTPRYTQPDPIGLAAGINPYAYVNGQPTRFTDPLGDACYAASPRQRGARSATAMQTMSMASVVLDATDGGSLWPLT